MSNVVVRPTEGTLAAMRLYFPASSLAGAKTLWHRVIPRRLSGYLLQAAHEEGIQQAIHHHVVAGYLRDDPLSHGYGENSPMKHPHCIELIDTEQRLRAFAARHADEFCKARVLVIHGAEELGPAGRP
ncbi:MAG: DUF190 domain-containing protein [Stenotrophomonas sp.]